MSRYRGELVRQSAMQVQSPLEGPFRFGQPPRLPEDRAQRSERGSHAVSIIGDRGVPVQQALPQMQGLSQLLLGLRPPLRHEEQASKIVVSCRTFLESLTVGTG